MTPIYNKSVCKTYVVHFRGIDRIKTVYSDSVLDNLENSAMTYSLSSCSQFQFSILNGAQTYYSQGMNLRLQGPKILKLMHILKKKFQRSTCTYHQEYTKERKRTHFKDCSETQHVLMMCYSVIWSLAVDLAVVVGFNNSCFF